MTEEKKPTDWRRIGGIMTALCVGAIAGIGSFAHLRDLAILNGQIPAIATLIPFSVDGLIVTATFCMNGDNQRWPRVGFTLGVIATISGNILIALWPKSMAVAIAVSAWAPIALLVTIEILVHYRPRKPAVADGELSADEAPTSSDETAPDGQRAASGGLPAVAPKTIEKIAKIVAKYPSLTLSEIAGRSRYSETTVRRALVHIRGPIADAELEQMTATETSEVAS